jgi:acyl-[acyl-carrier-protein]-phospholipid O-acyltransferase/long-chain-fatty-acid--[acyl-carrier-protein] ligase
MPIGTRLVQVISRTLHWLITRTGYRLRVLGADRVPASGPALLIANHVSLADGALVFGAIRRPVRFLIWRPHFEKPLIHWWMTRLNAIPVTPGRMHDVAGAIAQARAALTAGDVVCLFVEGSVTRTGNLLPFKRGFQRIVAGLDVPVLPVHLDGLWGSIFSFKGRRSIGEWLRWRPRRITIAVGEPLRPDATAAEAHVAMMALGAEAAAHRRRPMDLLHTAFIRTARRRWRHPAMSDSTGQRLTFGRTLTGALALSRLVRRRTPDQTNVGIMLPASVGGAIANIAVLMAGRLPVNLNFTCGRDGLDDAIAQAGLRVILTSDVFLKKAGLDARPGMVRLEDLKQELSALDRVRAFAAARLTPVSWLSTRVRHGGDTHAPATIVFSSGSTGVPKGVVLTHANILANVDSLERLFSISTSDCFVGVLPFFHSFGFTGTLWFPLLQGATVVYHPNPADAKTVGELTETHRATMLISTPTFCLSYLRRCTPEQFATLRYAFVGAEKLRAPLAEAFERRFGLPLLEGYGCTEMAPVVTANRPDVREGRLSQIGTKAGTVGHPIPSVAAKVVDQNSGEGPIFNRPGLLLVKGPNLMAGYLNRPDLTSAALRDGWYVTGDIATMDDDGFITITDRVSRFSKIAGEMVPHMKIEDTINDILGDQCSAVTAVPDDTRGERLVAFYTRADVAPADLWERLCATHLPRLWLPRREHLLVVDAIPTLGTGKVDLRGLRELAGKHTGTNVAGSGISEVGR